jgi:hypothetical protein
MSFHEPRFAGAFFVLVIQGAVWNRPLGFGVEQASRPATPCRPKDEERLRSKYLLQAQLPRCQVCDLRQVLRGCDFNLAGPQRFQGE